MARISAMATAVPPRQIDLPQARRMLERYAERLDVKAAPLLRILERTHIATRHTVLGEEIIDRDLDLKESTDLYIKTCLELGEQVARDAIERAGLAPEDIDSVISVSCTGYMIPSLDAYLLNKMQLRRNLRRTPITELGCMAGAVALSRAWEQLQAYRDSRVLIVSVELPSLTFQPKDARPAQIISSLIFCDGAAGVVVSNQAASRPSPRILGSRMYTVPGTIGDMGYDLDGDGLHIVLSSEVPYLIRRSLRAEVEALLAEHGLELSDLKWCAMHPAGPKVLDLVQEELQLPAAQLASSRKILEGYGNMSSAAVLFVLADMLENPPAEPGDPGIIVAFGPGVTGEILLARWEE